MNSLFDLNGRDIWVIGGAGYLGTATVKLLVQGGATVLCVDVGTRAQDMVKREKLEASVTAESFDASDGRATGDFIRANLARRGTPAGLVIMTYKSFPKSMNELQPEEFDEAMVSGSRTIAAGLGHP